MARTWRLSVRRPRCTRRTRLTFETLEDRTTPATDITAAAGAFAVTNDPGESVTLTMGRSGTNYVLQVTGSTFNLPAAIPGVTLSPDFLQATVTAANVNSWSFLLGDMDDTLVVGTGSLDFIAPVTVDGGDGSDALTLNDSTDTTANTYAISTTGLNRNAGGVTVDFSATEKLSLSAGTLGDTINVTSTDAGTPVTVSGGGGNDVITVGSAGNSLDGILGAVTVNGDAQGAADRLNIDDQGDGDDNTYTITATSIDRTGAGTITYGTMEEVVLNAANGDASIVDTIAVAGTASGSHVTVNGGIGDDAITVAGTATGSQVTVSGGNGDDTITIGNGSLDDVLGTVSVAGGTGADDLIVDDSTDADGNSYVVGTAQVTRAGAATVSYGSIATLAVNAGTGADTIGVSATAAATPVTINAGTGSDSITVGAGSLDTLAGPLTLVPGAGDTDTLTIDDSTDAGDKTYSATDTTVTRVARVFNYAADGFEQVVLKAGTGDDTISIAATASGIPVTVNGGAGDDTMTAAALDDLLGPVSLEGGTGTADRLVVNDSAQATGQTYSVSTAAVERTTGVAVSINYSAFDRVSLAAGSGADSISVLATAANVPVTVNAGTGSDAISVGGGSLDNVAGGLTLIAGPGDTDILTIDDSADTNDNAYTVSATAAVRTTGTDVTFNYASSGFERLVLAAGTGGDMIAVSATAATIPVTVGGGAGDDEISVGRLDNIDGPVTVNGDGGAVDTLALDDSADGGSDTYSISSTQVARTSGSVVVTFATLEGLTLAIGSGADTVNVVGTAASTPVTVSGGSGDDTFTVGSVANTLDDILGALAVNGDSDSGNDRLTINDQGDADNNSYTVTGTTVERSGAGTVTYSTVEAVVLNAGSGVDTISVTASTSGTPVSVNGGAGDDTITAGSGTLDNLHGPVTLNGGGPTNTLHVNDAADTSANTYTVAATQVTRTGAATLTYGGFSTLTVAAGTGNNTINVTGTSTGATTVTGGTGDDSFDVTGSGLAANSANTFDGGNEDDATGDTFTVSPVPDVPAVTTSITIIGGNAVAATVPVDTLFARLTTSQSTPPTFDGTQITFASGYLPIDYAEIEGTGLDTPQITVTSGTGNDTLAITATSADDGSFQVGATTTLFRNVEEIVWDAGSGDDTLLINNPAGGLFAPVTGVVFAAGGQPGDKLRILGGTATGGTFEVGPTAADVQITHTAAAGTLSITASGLPAGSAVQDTVTEGLFTAYATDASETIAVTDQPGAAGALTRVEVTSAAGVPLEVLNKARLVVHGGDAAAGGNAADVISLNLANAVGGAARVDVVGDDGDDTVLVLAVPATRSYTVDGGIGDDSITLGQAGTLDAVLGTGTVTGGVGADSLTLDDTADADANAYSVTGATVARVGAGILTYGTVEALVINAARGVDTFAVTSTPVGTLVRLDAGAGDDIVSVVAAAGPLAIDLGDGDDAVSVGTGTLDSVTGAVSVTGGAGADALSIDDSADASGNAYSVGLTQVARSAGGVAVVNFATVEQLGLTAGAGDDAVDVLATSLATAVTINAGDGDDAVRAGDGTLDNLLGLLTLSAGAGNDTLNVDDSADSDNNAYTISGLAVARTSVGNVSFAYPAQGFEELVLSAGTGNDSVVVAGTASGIPVTVNAGSGSDLLTVGAGSLGGVLSQLALDGEAGIDRLAVDDSVDAADNAYAVTATSVSRTNGVAISVGYSAVEQLALSAGTGNDAIVVSSTAAGVAVSVGGGAGNDVITAGSGTLDNLLGPLTPDGGAGTNRLVVDDSADSTDNAYSILAATVSRTDGTPVSLPYTSGFQSVALRAGTGDDFITATSSAAIAVSADGGGGDDTFSLGFLSGDLLGGTGSDTIIGDNAGRLYSLTGANAGTIAGLLATGFAAVENLTAGPGSDTFAFQNGGSLTGEVAGGIGGDTLNGDDAGRAFNLTGGNAGSVGGLVGLFSGIETVNGGAGNDSIVVAAAVPASGLARFNGGAGFDTADLSARGAAQQIVVTGRGGVNGFNVTGGSATPPVPAPIVTEGFFNIDRVFGSSTSNTDILTGLTGVAADWQVLRQAGADDSYAATGRVLAFDRFEQLVGQNAADDFRVDFSVGDAATSRLLLRGGGGLDAVRMIGGATVNRADTLTVLAKVRNWPTGSGGTPVFAGIGFNSGQPVLYDDAVETLDLQGGAGDDTFRVDPGPKPPKGVAATPLYGAGVRTLLLEGQLGADTFAVVPDKFTASGSDPRVTTFVFGGSGDAIAGGTIAAVDEQDRMTLYRLPARYKANFPVEGKKGPRTQVFDLKNLNFAPVRYYNMWTVIADINAPPGS